MRRKRLRIVLGLIFLSAIGYCGYWASKVSTAIVGEKPGGNLLSNLREAWGGLQHPLDQFDKNQINILLVGRDYNRDRKGMEYTKGSRADTIMMLHLDLEKATVAGLSIPRDTKVTARDGITSKINATLTRKGGIDLLSDTVSNLLGVSPDYTILIKPDAVKEIVDSIGGVDVETLDAMNYDDSWGNLHIHLPAGPQHIDGQQAVGFTRFREVNVAIRGDDGRLRSVKVVHSKEEGDARRMARQQQLIAAIMAAAKSPGNLVHADKIIDTGFKQLDTSLKRIQMVALATIFKGQGAGSMKTAQLIGGEENGDAYYFVPNEEKTKALVQYLFFDDAAAGNKLVRVAVYNGTSVKGVAKKAADVLETLNYDAFSGGNRPAATTSTVVFRTAAVEARARALAETLKITEIRKATPEEQKIEILGDQTQPDVYVTIGEDIAGQMVVSTEPEATTEEPVRPRRRRTKHRAPHSTSQPTAPNG